ncbi:MAG: prepilin-type N-terminal cleavage/methylation domain-containing protein [Cocleimonas sp.]
MKKVPCLRNSYSKKQKGFTLIEVVVALVIGGIVLGWAASKGAEAFQTYKIGVLADDVAVISKAMGEKYGDKASYAGASMVELEKILPDTIGDGTGAAPWGGDYSVGTGSSTRIYTVTTTNIAALQGEKAVLRWSNATYNSGTEALVITIGK